MQHTVKGRKATQADQPNDIRAYHMSCMMATAMMNYRFVLIFIPTLFRLLYICQKMQSPDKLCLKWINFQEDINFAFGVLRNDKEFSDVTLACEDGTQVEAHKVILASSSPFFMEILKRNKHPHPLIYMRGVKADALTATIDFLYYGEANVEQENLEAFLALADELRLKGLTGSAEINESKYHDEEASQKKIAPEKKRHRESIGNVPAPKSVHRPHIEEEFPSEMPVALVSDEVRQLDKQIKSMIGFSENRLTSGKQERLRICKICGKEGIRANIMTHIESNHITSNVFHSCDICGNISRSRNGLRLHKAKRHHK